MHAQKMGSNCVAIVSFIKHFEGLGTKWTDTRDFSCYSPD
jgi:hypothetical protein